MPLIRFTTRVAHHYGLPPLDANASYWSRITNTLQGPDLLKFKEQVVKERDLWQRLFQQPDPESLTQYFTVVQALLNYGYIDTGLVDTMDLLVYLEHKNYDFFVYEYARQRFVFYPKRELNRHIFQLIAVG
jgi:hypothetical protein